MNILKLCGLFLFCSGVAACVTSVQGRNQTAFDISSQAQMQPVSFRTNKFNIAGYMTQLSENDEVSVYIEGDGFAWIDRYTISPDPTPLDPIALRLASIDRSQNVIYLARPCQYVNVDKQRNCHSQYWTSHRFATEVLSSYNEILDTISKKTNGKGFHLVGFSGGAAIAALLSAQRSDVLSLRTIAGNLDHKALNRARNVSQLSGSLNPISVAQKLRHLPQVHYSGEEDKTIPSWVAQSFARAVGSPSCVKVQTVRNASHIEGWVSFWKTQYSQRPSC